jgi:RNase P/RNase MRP subunit POP5
MKNKIHSLPKSIRAVKRYFEFNCNYQDLINFKNYFLKTYGELKFAESDFGIKDFENKKIIKINREFEKQLKSCLENYNKNYEKKIILIKKSGTLKALVK